MIRINIIKSFLKKELKQLFRDPRMRLAIFMPPLLMALINGYAISNDVEKVRMAILDQDKTPQSQTLIDKFTSSGYFIPHSYLGSAKGASRLLDTGEVEVFLEIQKGFSKGIKSGKVSTVQIIIDGTDSSRAAVIVAYVNEIASNFSMDFLQYRIRNLALSKEVKSMTIRDPIKLKERYLYNPTLASINYFLPGMLCLIMSMTPLEPDVYVHSKGEGTGQHRTDSGVPRQYHGAYHWQESSFFPFEHCSFIDGDDGSNVLVQSAFQRKFLFSSGGELIVYICGYRYGAFHSGNIKNATAGSSIRGHVRSSHDNLFRFCLSDICHA